MYSLVIFIFITNPLSGCEDKVNVNISVNFAEIREAIKIALEKKNRDINSPAFYDDLDLPLKEDDSGYYLEDKGGNKFYQDKDNEELYYNKMDELKKEEENQAPATSPISNLSEDIR